MMRRFFFICLVPILLCAQYPRIGNYYLSYFIPLDVVDSLAQCDFLVLDHDVVRTSPKALDSLRVLNPEITIIAYITSQEVNLDPPPGSLREFMLSQVRDEWWLRDATGAPVVFWSGTRMLNMAQTTDPVINANTWGNYLASVINDSILSDSRWDGVYLDNCWSAVSWVTPQIDVDGDGIADKSSEVDVLWHAGMEHMLGLIRAEHPDHIIVGNGGYRFGNILNGSLFEEYSSSDGGAWRLLDAYLHLDSTVVSPSKNLVNAGTFDSGIIDYQVMRFGLVSTLMGSGYYSYDFGPKDHAQNWWFDEYGYALGSAKEPAQIKGRTFVITEDFDTGVERWQVGNGGSIVSDTVWHSDVVSYTAPDHNRWNLILLSEELTLSEKNLFKLSLRVRIESKDEPVSLYAILRKGESYAEDISLGGVLLLPGTDSLVTFYSTEAFPAKSGYSLLIGMEDGGSVVLDSICLESNKSLTLSRRFEHGCVLLNVSPSNQNHSFPEYERLLGKQDPDHNNGRSAVQLELATYDGIVLKKRELALLPEQYIVPVKQMRLTQNGVITFFASSQPVQAEIFAANGRMIGSSLVACNGTVVNWSSLSSGVYFVRIKIGSEKIFLRGIK